MSIDDRTTKALGIKVMTQLRLLQFCIVGCGGTGANFAEMLVRTGATKLVLIDGAKVNCTDLNRVSSFYEIDCGDSKAEVLKRRLISIRKGLEIHVLTDNFRMCQNILPGQSGQTVRDAVYNADVVFIGTDRNTSRLAIEKLCREKLKGMFLSCGVLVDHDSGIFELECAWSPATPAERVNDAGYGPVNASYASIVYEATAMAFTMLLSHLRCPDSDFKAYRRIYDSSLRPIDTFINGKSSGSKL